MLDFNFEFNHKYLHRFDSSIHWISKLETKNLTKLV